MSDTARSSRYEIRVEGVLDPRWTAWFEGLAIGSDDSQTVISGPVADQAALHGLLNRVGDIGLGPDFGTPPRSRLTQRCPDALAPGRSAAKVVADHPGQGWSLLCNGVVLFDDGGALLPGGQAVAPATAGPVRTAA